VGQVVEVLRGRWVYGVISLLAEAPKAPRELHAELAEVHKRLHWLFGDRPMADGALYKPLRDMTREGLLQHVGERAAFPQIAYYQLSPISETLLGSLDLLAPWCEANYGYLERMTRIRYGVDPESPTGDAAALDERAQVMRLRRAIGMSFGLFSPRWSWGLLSVISEGPRSPGELFAVNAARIANNRHTTGQRTMSEKVGYDMLHWLDRCDLISKRDANEEEPGRVVYELTEFGRGLMNAFRPVGETMKPFYEDMVSILRERRGLDSDNQPWPSTLLAVGD